MIKSTIQENTKTPPRVEYPRIMRDTRDGQILLVTGVSQFDGHVSTIAISEEKSGHYPMGSQNSTRLVALEDFAGTITISNS